MKVEKVTNDLKALDFVANVGYQGYNGLGEDGENVKFTLTIYFEKEGA